MLPLAAALIVAAVVGFFVIRDLAPSGPGEAHTPSIEEATLIGQTDWVSGVATTTLDGQPIAISSSAVNTLRVWDLTKRAATK